MRMTLMALWLLASLPVAGFAETTMQWREAAAGGGGHGGHGRAGLQLLAGDGARAEIVLPTLEHRPLGLAAGRALLRPTGFDNYHLLLATRQRGRLQETALRYQSLRGRPSGRSPAQLLAAAKVPLEIRPSPLPREHSHYLAATVAVFEVLFRQRPLAAQPVALETANGTRLFAVTDENGRLFLPLPDDFAAGEQGRRQRVPAGFVLAARHEEGGVEYRTTLSADYFRNPEQWQSSRHGLWAALAGFVVGLVLLQWLSRRMPASVGRNGGAV